MYEYYISNKSISPPGEWSWEDPKTGHVFKHYDYVAFSRMIRDYRIANNIPIKTDWEEEICDDMCKVNMPLWGSICKRFSTKFFITKAFSFAAASSFLSFLNKWISSGAKYVEQQEADERALICIGCEFNKTISHSCGSCMSKMHNIISLIKKDKKTALDEKLGQCQICSCVNKVQIWFPLEVLQQSIDPKTVFPDYCWKFKK